MKTLFLLVGIFLSGCATTPNYYSPYLKTFLGQPESAVIETFGPPDKVYETTGIKTISYLKDQGSATVPIYGMWVPAQRYCKTVFQIQLDHVAKANWEGNTCTAPESFARPIETKAAESRPKLNFDDSFR